MPTNKDIQELILAICKIYSPIEISQLVDLVLLRYPDLSRAKIKAETLPIINSSRLVLTSELKLAYRD